MSTVQFIDSVTANIAYWRDHEGLTDPGAWSALDRERANLFRAVEFGLQQAETWLAASDLALECYSYIFERGYWSEWALILELALSACPGENAVQRGHLTQRLGNLYRKMRRLDEAQAAYAQTESIGRAAGDAALVAKAHLGFGQVLLRLHQYDEAEEWARLALAEFETQGTCMDMMAHAHNVLGLIALGRGLNEDAVEELYQARDLFRQSQQSIEIGRTSINLIEALSGLDRVAEALAMSEEAATIFEVNDLQLEHSRLHLNMGFLHYSQGDLARAEAAFRQAYSPALRRAGPVYTKSIIEMNLGNVLLLQGQYDESRTYFLSAVAGFRLVEAQTLLANSLDGLAEIAIARGNGQNAMPYYEEALHIVTAIPEDAFANRMEKRFRELLDELRSAAEETK